MEISIKFGGGEFLEVLGDEGQADQIGLGAL